MVGALRPRPSACDTAPYPRPTAQPQPGTLPHCPWQLSPQPCFSDPDCLAKAGDTVVAISTTMSTLMIRTLAIRLITHLLSYGWAELIRPRPVSQHLQYVARKNDGA